MKKTLTDRGKVWANFRVNYPFKWHSEANFTIKLSYKYPFQSIVSITSPVSSLSVLCCYENYTSIYYQCVILYVLFRTYATEWQDRLFYKELKRNEWEWVGSCLSLSKVKAWEKFEQAKKKTKQNKSQVYAKVWSIDFFKINKLNKGGGGD